jgi:predicted transcriptional regulator
MKLTAAQVAEMRQLSASGVRQNALAARFGVTPAHVSMILGGKRWAASSSPPPLAIPDERLSPRGADRTVSDRAEPTGA